MSDPIFFTDRQREVILERLKLGMSAEMPQVSQTLNLTLDPNYATDRLAARLTAFILAERLPPQRLRGEVQDMRWATWYDHLKATVQDRWWAAAYVRRWPPRAVEVPIRVSVPVQGWWTYPHAPYVIGAGSPVLIFDTGEPVSWREGGVGP
jgi:hypothetical protein